MVQMHPERLCLMQPQRVLLVPMLGRQMCIGWARDLVVLWRTQQAPVEPLVNTELFGILGVQ